MVKGFKCFDKGLTSRYGDKYEVGKTYHDEKIVKFHEGGFHMCTNLEDTLRYFDAINGDVDIALVTGDGEINKYDDEYNEFFDMYAVEYLTIDRVLSRDEIIEYVLKLPPYRVKRFITLFSLTPDEIELFKEKFYKDYLVLDAINYYQNDEFREYAKKK